MAMQKIQISVFALYLLVSRYIFLFTCTILRDSYPARMVKYFYAVSLITVI